MSYRVAKSFCSTVRRFPVGAEVSANEDLSPHTIASALAAKLIEPAKSDEKPLVGFKSAE